MLKNVFFKHTVPLRILHGRIGHERVFTYTEVKNLALLNFETMQENFFDCLPARDMNSINRTVWRKEGMRSNFQVTGATTLYNGARISVSRLDFSRDIPNRGPGVYHCMLNNVIASINITGGKQ